MEVVRKNLFSIIFGVVAILAVVALYWPISGLYDGLQKTMEDRMAIAHRLENLASATRNMPILSPDEVIPQPLGVFPTPRVIQLGIDATVKIASEAKKMLAAAVQANTHDPLLAGELPKPDNSTRYDFAAAYSEAVTNYARWKDLLHLVTPPTADEVQAETKKLRDKINKDRLVLDERGNPTQESKTIADNEYAAESPAVKPNMELQRAQGGRIYVLPNAFPLDKDINRTAATPSPDRITDAQIKLWVVDDVAKAVTRANDKYTDPATPGGPPQHDVLHSAVKQIERIDDLRPIVTTSADLAAGLNNPIPKVIAVSDTGRVCNSLYDVLHFKVHLVVDAAKIIDVIQELEYGQFITVTNVQFNEVVDPVKATADGFRFGNKPVVHVEFECEELLMRAWTNGLLPESRKNGLGKTALAPATPSGEEEPPYGEQPYGEQPYYNGGAPGRSPYRGRGR